MADETGSNLLPVLSERFERVLSTIEDSAERAGRDSSEIVLLPVTKTVPTEVLRATYALGYHDFAENRVQEMKRKADALADLGPTWHLIGHLQTNKANQVARLAKEVQSVDSLRIAEALSRASFPKSTGRVLDVLLQVNTSGEEAKYGLSPAQVPEILDVVAGLPGLIVRGFMTMAPLTDDEAVIRRTFADLRELRDRLAPQYEGDGVELAELSMGMSGDYPIAVEEGATIVRVGSALFGPRS
ncbi:YggS family pyridoxal phosphate-dependent enzyme [Actinomycetaceae bacterium MB13-C1-2]|nr:YggS family pyridoxal phosphate-dependent enzyme [Actinomycetaceae bacterium MB13-C1-2]